MAYFYPLHLEPVNFYGGDAGVYDIVLANAEHIAQVGFYLPTHSFLEHTDIVYICALIRKFYDTSLELPPAPRVVGWADQERSKLLTEGAV